MLPHKLISPTVYGKKIFYVYIYIMMARVTILHSPESNVQLFSIRIGKKIACVFELNMNPKPCQWWECLPAFWSSHWSRQNLLLEQLPLCLEHAQAFHDTHRGKKFSFNSV
uniref:Uncharacterized protein n=1 Tax=Rhipicephalus zambeziensis TaxID=60191 RepID=A0A224YFF9_9ACAR